MGFQKKRKKTICIIGCGMAGGILASELLKKKNKIILIDSDTLNKNHNNNETVKDFPFFNLGHSIKGSRSFGFGGTSNLWHGGLTALTNSDFYKINKIAGYKIYPELFRLYSKTFKYFDIDYDLIKKIKINILNNKLYKLLVSTNIFIKKNIFLQKEPLQTRSIALSFKDNPNITIVENAVALTISKKKNNSKTIDHVNVLIDKKKINEIHADIFVISCGSLESPRLFLQSIHEKKINLKNHNIGRNIIDHPFTSIAQIKSKKIKLEFSDIFLFIFKRKFRFRLGFSLKDTSKGNHSIVIRPKNSLNYINLKKNVKRLFSRNFFLGFCSFFKNYTVLKLLKHSANFINRKIGFFGPSCEKAEVLCHLEQSASKNSFIKLSKKYCNYRIIPTIKWIVTKQDIAEFNRVNSYLKNIFKDNKYFLYQQKKISTKKILTAAHHAGTMRISKNSYHGVVDKNLKVHNLNNVYVCDLSIFPFYGNSNPSFTLVAFAIRLSNYLNKSNS